MGRLLDQVHGPFFDFLVLDEYEITKWDELGVPWDVIPTYFHHPDALRVAETIVALGSFCFAEAHPRFNFCGLTLYQGENLDRLLMWLRLFVQGLLACREPREFEKYAKKLFGPLCVETTYPWQNYWPEIQDEVADCFEEIISLGREAKEESKVLLVLGV